jgi:N-acylneuraminate cytidylyltransferase
VIPAYHDAGMFYWGRSSAFLEKLPMFAGASRPFLIPSHRVCDLDTLEDWERAEWMMKAKLLAANTYA